MVINVNSTTDIFKALGEPNRLRIMAVLSSQPACVCELAEALSLNQPNLSRHLRYLRQVGLVESRPAGPFTEYLLTTSSVARPFHEIVAALAQHAPSLQRDIRALRRADRQRISSCGRSSKP
ncbi:MAG: winged helix-turn-helix transcriptional regulator [Candidatus Coatesbacteria bacterium]|nr:MAG: winged helix-turn-helix transcriptional regulator [Candidatus Coatesbacteria bacterium]